MWITGCDFHLLYQQIPDAIQQTGELVGRRLCA